MEIGLIAMPFAIPENVTNLQQFFQYNNDITQSMFMPVIVLVIWIILFASMKSVGQETKPALSASTFILLLLTIILRGASLVTDSFVAIVLIGFLGMIIYIIIEKD